jgi:hypothetical protein
VLFEAAYHGNVPVVQLLLARGAKTALTDCEANEPGEVFADTVPPAVQQEITALIERHGK